MTHIATFRALLDAHALDVLRLDVPAIWASRRAAGAGARRGKGSARLSAHLSGGERPPRATAPGAIVETFDPALPGGNPLDPAHLLCSGGPAFRDGTAVAPETPGLGFELDWARFRP